MGQTFRRRDDSLQDFMKMDRARNAMLLLLFRTFNDFRREGPCCWNEGKKIPVPRCCVSTATEYHSQGDKFAKLIPWLLARGIIAYTGRQNDWARGCLIVEEMNAYNYETNTEQRGRRENVQDVMSMLEMSKSYDVSNDTFPTASDPNWSYRGSFFVPYCGMAPLFLLNAGVLPSFLTGARAIEGAVFSFLNITSL